MLQSMVSQRVGHNLVTEQQHGEPSTIVYSFCCWAFEIAVIMNEDSWPILSMSVGARKPLS